MKKVIRWIGMICVAVCAQAQDFAVEGSGVHKIVSASHGRSRVLYISELEGGVSCYTPEGKKLWRNPSVDSAVLFEIEAADVDGDGSEELLAAGGNGLITCWNTDGSVRWRFSPGHKVRFSEIAVVGVGAASQLFAGGNDRVLYKLDANGKQIGSMPIPGVVRLIAAGNFQNKRDPSIFLMTYSHDKFRWEFFGFIDPDTLKVQNSLNYKDMASRGWKSKNWGSLMVTDLAVADMDQDGLDDLLFFGDSLSVSSTFRVINGALEDVGCFVSRDHKAARRDKQRYAHTIGVPLFPFSREVLVQNGRILYRVGGDGKLIARADETEYGFSVSDIHFDADLKKVFMAGAVSGGNGIYVYDVTQKNWLNRSKEYVGRMQEVRDNLDRLYHQVLAFEPPAYQQPVKKPWVVISGGRVADEVQALDFNPIQFVDQHTWSEDFDRSDILAAVGKEEGDKRDGRKPYKLTRDEIVALARANEKNKEPFTLWAGHGTDPFFNDIGTLEAVLEAAPTTCYGFIYAEMHDANTPRVKYYLENYLPRLARACRKSENAILYFRFKNMFWVANVQQPGWKEMFLSGDYHDILIPAAEDTSSRTQDLNFVGRVGMLLGGAVDDYAIRLIDDNPTNWRPLSPGTQRSPSPFVRNGVLGAAYGSRYGIHFGSSFDGNGLNLLYAILSSGVMPEVTRDQIASVGSWHLVQTPDPELFHSIDDHHSIDHYSPDDVDAVFSLAQMHWTGAGLPDYDFSSAALGVGNRWLNFIPVLPHGMIPVGPAEFAPMLKKQGVPFTVSDGKRGFVDGQPVAAAAFGQTITAVAQAGAEKLPVLVAGASWSSIWLDETHLRVVLIDPGYLTPQQRNVEIRFQNKKPASVMDILSGEALAPVANVLAVKVPAGSMRFIDVAYE